MCMLGGHRSTSAGNPQEPVASFCEMGFLIGLELTAM